MKALNGVHHDVRIVGRTTLFKLLST